MSRMIRIQREDFDVGAELARFGAGNARIGGVCVFVGLVRDLTDDTEGGRNRPVAAMTLEHYPGMTEAEIARIEAEARARWPLDDVLVIHRHGRLEPGERIVLVATASAHREAAFESCHFLIDWLKTKAPFWKREETPEGGQWVAARESDDAAAARWTRAAKAKP
jgi:molybdopterin synthase catalytic subunit